jgi:hypothetical protein
VPVRAGELAVGQSLQRPVYDWHGKLLLGSGHVIESASQLEALTDSGFVHDSSWDLEAAPSKESIVVSSGSRAAARPQETADDPASTSKDVILAMDHMRWYVGETLYLQLLDNQAVRYTARLIGFVKNKTVFVTAPSVDGKFEFVRDGQTFVVRAFSGKKAYAFATAAEKSVHAPHPYLYLAYPKEVRCTVVRRGVRGREDHCSRIAWTAGAGRRSDIE